TQVEIHRPGPEVHTYVVPDSREGWVESLRLLLRSYFSRHFTHDVSPAVTFDYSRVRGPGEPIRGFGGTSSGPGPLKSLHEQIRTLLERHDQTRISLTAITDIMNLIGQCVVAGNVRRTAQIALGDVSNAEYRRLKDYRWDP